MGSTGCRATLERRRAVFVGVARNCERHLDEVLKNLERLGALYERVSFVFVVSDSQDGTASILGRWLASGHRGRVVDAGNLEGHLPLRTQRLAHVRNICMEQISEGEEATYDHLIVVDLDDVLSAPISVNAFAKAARWLDGTSMRGGVFANGRPRYYDIWALRHDMWCPRDCWHQIWFRDPGQDERDLKAREVFARMIRIPLWFPPIGVLSAFGGIGIYKLRLATTARYVGLDEQGRETCEHVAFNAAVRQAGGRLYIFPALIAWSPSEHIDQLAALPRRLRLLVIWRRLVMTVRCWLAASSREATSLPSAPRSGMT
ncbi:glycosyltransferase family A protein [Enhydrobacter sp.]|jgi:hypothetical protein|uniref:glycosyltransferase family A protein n=1 Tax=Enhydrobacter sp. TaxID=1894999 RepID=UPI002630B1F4|nr:glycosyltransferase family A protein [Enhydrobacter sp.]